MINILSPSRSYAITKAQIDAGADEVYMGVDYGDYLLYSFGGRYKSMGGMRTQLKSMEELEKNVKYCKDRNVLIQVAANMHYIPPEFEEQYMQFVRECADLGVDQIIVSNVGLIRMIHKERIPIEIVAGSFTFIPNSEMIKYLESIGVVRVVLPHATTLEEIRKIKKSCPNVQLEIFALIGGGNNCGRCMMFHSPIRDDIGPGCRAFYTVDYEGERYENVNILDAAADCCLCSMGDLMDAGVDSLKIVGRETKNERMAAKFTEIFYKYREGLYQGKSDKVIKEELSRNELAWDMIWRERFCKKGKCKFHQTNVTKSYI